MLSASDLRSPRVAVLVNGILIDGIISVIVTSNSHLGAARYQVQASLTATGYSVWSADQIQIEIQFGVDEMWASLIVGPADRVTVDPVRGYVRADGRDLTARFIEARTQETFENKTASDVVAELALRRGLVPLVTPTTELFGRNFHNVTAQTTLDQHGRITTEWDLLVRLAEVEQFDVWVDGTTLNFAPAVQAAAPLSLVPQDCISLRLERSLASGNGLQVVVKSWDCRSAQTVIQSTAGSATETGNSSYVVVRPNLTAQAAQSLAGRILSQISQHGRTVSIEMPGDLTTRPRGTLLLAETGTDFDGVYMITSVDRQMSSSAGFTQSVEAMTPPWMTF